MALSKAPYHSPHEEKNQDDTISDRRVHNPEAFEALNAHLKQARSADEPETDPISPDWHLPPTTSRTRYSALGRSRHQTYVRRRLIRANLRHAQRAMTQRSRLAIIASVLGTVIPMLLLATTTGGAAGLALSYYLSEQPALANINTAFPGDSLKIYDANGTLIYELSDHGSRTSVPLNQIAQNVIHATIAIEDKDFWTNQGVDFLAVVRAASDDLSTGHIVSGASTITQQLVKRAILGPQVTLDRKLREMVLAIGLTHQMTKQDILNLYLNTIYYGEQAYGIDAAAQTYFGLQDQPGHPAAAQLDLAQASLLAGLPQSPSDLDPLVNFNAALNRQKAVLQQMVIQGYITPLEELQAENEAQAQGFLKPSAPPNLAPHFTEYVLQELQSLINKHLISAGNLSRSGLSIHTTLNVALQNQIQQVAQQHIQDMAWHHMSNAAVVGIDFHTGAIFTLLGSIDYNNPSIDGQFDVATQGYRQPGSSFKPFVYATAFEKGWSPGTPISDTALTVQLPPGSEEPTYSPKDYDNKFWGELTIRQALQNSRNVPAVRALVYTGIQDSLNTAQQMGITSYQGSPGYSMVLGGLGVHLLDETSAYGVFADGGVRVPPYSIQSVTDQNGKTIYQHQQSQGQQVISPQVAGLITNTLSDDQARQREFGVCSPLMLYDGPPYSGACQRGDTGPIRPAAAKTGTTDDFKDNLTLGYTTDYVIGVWSGNNDGSPMINVSGVDGAAPIWHDAMLAAEQGHPIQDFTLPHGLIRATVHYPDGITSTDWYLPGTVPPGAFILGQS
jgi:membrane peptidoglycan carboxypeptidase